MSDKPFSVLAARVLFDGASALLTWRRAWVEPDRELDVLCLTAIGRNRRCRGSDVEVLSAPTWLSLDGRLEQAFEGHYFFGEPFESGSLWEEVFLYWDVYAENFGDLVFLLGAI